MSRKEFNHRGGIRSSKGRYYGTGIQEYDPYGDYTDSTEYGHGTGYSDDNPGCKLPHDNLIYKRKEWEKLNGPVIIVKEGKK